MAHPLDLDPAGYQGTYKLIGGSPALDFANLVSYRGTDREHDWLDPAMNLPRWVAAAQVDAPADEDVAELRAFRELLARVFLALTDGDSPPADDVAVLGERAVRAWSHRQLRFPAGAPAAAWIDTAPSLLDQLALEATSLLTSEEALSRLAACRECRWLFVDTTRNRSRRWCDPADCGNRARQRRHYHRHAPPDRPAPQS